MEILNTITGFLANPWVAWTMALLIPTLTGFGVIKIKGLSKFISEFVDIAKAHQEATDPAGEAGGLYSPAERAKLDKEFQEFIAAGMALLGK